ncbi:hypothetical protein [Natrinema sp. 1APR25-10V2]|uniref:hypothetical protein n=1 Tax=Natrinema sp. 1APR25-10V2 TaxID=2951081 RepID=UPI0028753B8F|nr:hypothetical protein [Natrinema sp. 1APR25-10V2]MDS0477179.1 hypothetical protein [Natrinema sp. 1APR25-10V2]
MATRDIYTDTCDEDVQATTTDCPDCGGNVYQTDRETIYEDYDLVFEENHLD